MEIKKQNKFVTFFKRFGVYVIAGAIIVVIAIAATLVGVLTNKSAPSSPVTSDPLVFGTPLANATVIKDYNDKKLQHNQTLDRWEAHFSVDLTSEDPTVLSVLDGTVADVYYKYMTGYVVEIKHDDGFVSIYRSLDKDVDVKKGDSIKKGQKIGKASTTAAGEAGYGAHVDFTLLLDGKEVDPNNYISLQNK